MSLVATATSTTPACPNCHALSSQCDVQFGHAIHLCSHCEHRFCQSDEDFVDRYFDDSYFQGGSVAYFDYFAQREHLVAQGIRYGRLLRHFAPQATSLLDLGSAAGFLLAGMEQVGWSGMGIEPNEMMASHAREQMGVDLTCTTIEEFATDRQFDAVTMIQIISHLRRPMECLRQAREWIADDGVLLLESWDSASWTARLLGKRWHQLNPPTVLHWYTKPRIRTMLRDAGFEVVRFGRPVKWISVSNGAAILRQSIRQSGWESWLDRPLQLMTKVPLNLPYLLDDVFWCVARPV